MAVPEQQPFEALFRQPWRPPNCLGALLAVLALLATHACDGGEDSTSPDETSDLTGTYVGDYTVSMEPGTVYRAGLTLLQTGQSLRGQLSTDGLRTGLVSLMIDGSALTGELEYTDDCVGSAEVTASIQADADRIVGSYNASDCSGQYTGTFDLVRRTGQQSPPTVVITVPEDGSTFVEGASITFEGSGIDPDGGSVALRWRSSRAGDLGSGSPIHRDDLSDGVHIISLIGIDDEVQIRATSRSITISDHLTGNFVGDYTVSTEPDTVYRARLTLSQTGRHVAGQLTTNALRTALVSWLVDGPTLTGGLEYTDDCPGWAEVTATIENGGGRIAGSYSASDCSGQYTGTFDVVRRTGELIPPTVTITAPEEGAWFIEGRPITLRGTGTDPDGGNVALQWQSSRDGFLGTGSSLERDDLSAGAHTIELIGIDDEVQLATESTSVTVVAMPGSFALRFDGYQHAETPDADDLDLRSTFTIEVWIKPTNVTDAYQHLVSKWGWVELAAYHLAITNQSGLDRRLQFGTRDSPGGSYTFAHSRTPLENDMWQHVAAVFDDGVARLYINGQLDTLQVAMHVPQATDQIVALGREGHYNESYYRGFMDEVRIWNVARTAAEIAANMNVNLTGSEPGLVAYWPMDEGEGDTAFDLTGNGHNMRLRGPTWVWPGKL